jgi:HKD family nuclease
MTIRGITQPSGGSIVDAISWILEQGEVSRLDIAAAYITSGGVRELIPALRDGIGDEWPNVEKRWVTSFDYLRTEPVALEAIRGLPGSLVLGRKGCVPAVPFHPKSFIFTGPGADFVLSGSGNISKSGLTRGHEAGIVVGAAKPTPASSADAAACIGTFGTWFDGLWAQATTLNAALLRRYSDIYESQPNLQNPAPTEDDVAPEQTRPRQLTPQDLRKLRVCRNLWIEAGNITPNRGAMLPGNQLMMKRLTRVFFGVSPHDVPRDTLLGYLKIAYGNREAHDCSLTFSNNLMDKLTLPIPGVDGPPKYDGKNLLFRRVRPGFFELTLGTAGERARWRRRSKDIGAAFTMSGGRAWGVF